MGNVCGTENQEGKALPPPVAVDDGQPRILPPVTVAKKESGRGSFLKKGSYLSKDDDAVKAPVFQGHDGTPAVSKGKVLAEYVWLGGAKTTGGFDIRQKTRTLMSKPEKPEDLPVWNFDGSSTGQAPGDDSEVLLQPVAVFDDPFRGGEHVLVMCECLSPGMEAIPTNTRRGAKVIFEDKVDEQPWFGIEQEYTLFEKDMRTPLGWPGATRADRAPAAPQCDRLGRRVASNYRDKPAGGAAGGGAGGFPGPQGPYYCSAGTDVAFGRHVMEAHYQACLYAGIMIGGTNAEVMPGQWEYQIGPCEGIASGDHLWMSRYLLIRVCEALGINVSFDPKPIPGDWNGAGCHTNYSTAKMRAGGGYKEILSAIEKLGKKHQEHIQAYGEGNHRRLTGAHETASIDKFSYGVANRGASIRIPRTAEADQRGYFEDRRPASNMDPYVVTSKIFHTTCID